MTLDELSYKFFNAHILMGLGAAIGAGVAESYGLSYPLAVGLLTGLLFSIHLYRECTIVLINEYKRLKAKEKNEKQNIS